jgi:hypothetical protein
VTFPSITGIYSGTERHYWTDNAALSEKANGKQIRHGFLSPAPMSHPAMRLALSSQDGTIGSIGSPSRQDAAAVHAKNGFRASDRNAHVSLP